jgi:hypothetical protein
MVAVPIAMPVMLPVVVLIVATAVLAELQVPSEVMLSSIEVAPAHIDLDPVIGVGPAFTVCVLVACVPQPVLYAMVTVPAPVDVIAPVSLSMVATDVLLLLHTPNGTVFSKSNEYPLQEIAMPVIAAGVVVTVTVFVAYTGSHEPVTVYEIFTVPGAIPLTTPDVLIVAIAVFSELHTPPEVVLVRLVVDPAHILEVPPLIAFTVVAFTTVIDLLTLVPHNAVNVIFAVPIVTPFTTPVVSPTVARPVLLLFHVPPGDVLVIVVGVPIHIVLLPVIVDGTSPTVTADVNVLFKLPVVLQVPVADHVISQ